MSRLGLGRELVDRDVYERTVRHFTASRIALPRFSELADPATIPAAMAERALAADPDAPDPANLFRVHWHVASDRRSFADVPDHLVLGPELTGVEAPIAALVGRNFPMIRAHKVLAAYACLVPRLVTGAFDPGAQRAVWPSTGNYCRGGVAISRILGCRGVAVLPEGMSAERFAWLERWVADPADVIRTPGTESNVKEIYDRCKELARDPRHVVFNQFCEFGNHLAHWACTGRALERVYDALARERPRLRPRVFVAATGSAGTLGAGDWLKERLGTAIAAVEAAECPTMLENGFGEHNIQGIGDKHVPLIHNVMHTDYVIGVSDRDSDRLALLLHEAVGRDYLAHRRGVDDATLARLDALGLSAIANVVASIKLARYLRLGPDDLVLTVATDGAEMYGSERARIAAREFPGGFDRLGAAEVFGEHLAGARPDLVRELTLPERRRIFNLGYFTWVEQQGVRLEDFTRRADQSFWRGLRGLLDDWDARIDEFNARTGARSPS